jgi:hypothetical protein
MEKLSRMEIRVKKLVNAFLADKITLAEFNLELSKEKARARSKRQRILPKDGGKTYS